MWVEIHTIGVECVTISIGEGARCRQSCSSGVAVAIVLGSWGVNSWSVSELVECCGSLVLSVAGASQSGYRFTRSVLNNLWMLVKSPLTNSGVVNGTVDNNVVGRNGVGQNVRGTVTVNISAIVVGGTWWGRSTFIGDSSETIRGQYHFVVTQ